MRKSIYTQAVDGIKAPDRAVRKMLETARGFDKKEKIINMKKFRNGVIAASLAAVLAVGGFFGVSQMKPKADNPKASPKTNSFIMTVNAAEINDTAFTTIGGLPYSRFSAGSRANAGFNVDFMNHITGENIESITYSIKGGAFIITDEYSKKLIGGKKSEINTAHEENKKLYSEITVPYNDQPDGDKNINNEIAFLLKSDFRADDKENTVLKFEELTTKYADIDFDALSSAQKEEFRIKWENYCNFVLENNKILVKVKFKDGKTDTKNMEFCSNVTLDSNEADIKDNNGNWGTKIIEYLTMQLKAKLV